MLYSASEAQFGYMYRRNPDNVGDCMSDRNRDGCPPFESFVLGFELEDRGCYLLKELGNMVICDEAMFIFQRPFLARKTPSGYSVGTANRWACCTIRTITFTGHTLGFRDPCNMG